MSETDKIDMPTIEAATAVLAGFFESNPYSKLVRSGDEGALEIATPWGDQSIAFDIQNDFGDIADVLNSVVLPERLSALWHKDTRLLEVVWTAYKLPESQKDVQDREFVFSYKGTEHRCYFGASSGRLLFLARYTEPRTISTTNHRNMQSFAAYERARIDGELSAQDSFDCPRSFWISNVDWNEASAIELINHLNFHMTYFDGLSPTVVLHPATNEPVVPIRTRYIREGYPSHIDCASLDENMLSFWAFAQTGNAMLRFLLYYRILEYAAYHFVTEEVREQLKKVLLAPDMRSNMNRSIGDMMSAMGAMKLSDTQRLRALARTKINHELLWRDLKANSEFFTKDTNFDGGFSVKAPIGRNDTCEAFSKAGVERVMDRFREIRNALSHGKDQETSGVIRPTPENVNLFQPWVHLIATAAGEVVLAGTDT